ncbi:phosphoglycerate mutase [Diaporthe amygdali]|uniref:phosphoglycerate mutase n=1 Tax=Phomopsis amygdali TaxID=1214568 RepID=UPI0022FE46E9|nr:phosphoglycerate mutase [Diaporthe amygdali]KAJ0120172.1 phosphoglycerate mutase [Diaporthe amygdali]
MHSPLGATPWRFINYTIFDPELSELGRQQCQQLNQNLREKLLKDLDVGLILCSPMRRTCETTMLALGDWAAEKGVPIQAHAGWQENSAKPCDTGSPIASVAAEFPKIDFSHVDPVWPDKTSPAGEKYSYVKKHLLARAQSNLEDLYNRPEKAIIVVSHSGFLRQAVTGDWYFNADYRIYDLVERKDGADKFEVKQWDLTKSGHGGMGWSWDELVEIGVGLPEHALPPTDEEPLPSGVRPN